MSRVRSSLSRSASSIFRRAATASARSRADSIISRSTSSTSLIPDPPAPEGIFPSPSTCAEADSDVIPRAMRRPTVVAEAPAINRNAVPPAIIAHSDLRPGASTSASGMPSVTDHPDSRERLNTVCVGTPSTDATPSEPSSDSGLRAISSGAAEWPRNSSMPRVRATMVPSWLMIVPIQSFFVFALGQHTAQGGDIQPRASEHTGRSRDERGVRTLRRPACSAPG